MKSMFLGNQKNLSEIFLEKFADLRFSNGIGSERENNPVTPARGEVNSLELTPSQQETIRYQFESYCKKIIREKYRDCVRQARRLAENEVTFSELTVRELNSLCAYDDYPTDHFHFTVDGDDVIIRSERLYRALSELPPIKREIVLLAVCLGKSDVEIAAKLNMVSRTVQYQRTSTLARLQKIMGGQEHEKA